MITTNQITGFYQGKTRDYRGQRPQSNPIRLTSTTFNTDALINNLPRIGLDIRNVSSSTASYTIYNSIGEGGMGRVHRAISEGKLYALKVPLPESKKEQKKEGIMGIITAGHPNLLRVVDMGQQDGEPFVVSELLEGQDIRQLMTDGYKFSLPIARKIIVEVAGALQHLHDVGVVHRDIKPENIVVEIEKNAVGEIKLKRLTLIDFGLVVVMTESKNEKGIVRGTKGYMSPEQTYNDPLDERSDIFALGIVLLELMTGINPFIKKSHIETLINIREKEVPPELVAPLPQPLQKIILKMLAKNKEDRYQDCNQVIADLEKIA